MSAGSHGMSEKRPTDSQESVGQLVVRAVDESSGGLRARENALAALVPVLGRHARTAGFRAVAAGRWLTDEVVDIAPRIPARSAEVLRAQHPGLSDIQIAEQLVSSAARTTAAIGAAAGALASVEFAAPPTLLAAPVQLAAEMLVVSAVELKLVSELHEICGQPVSGSATERAGAYLTAWVRRRAAVPNAAGSTVTSVFGSAAKRELRAQLIRRLGRSTTTLAPFFAGAVAGAEVNRRATRGLGEALLRDLQARGADRWLRQL